MGTGITDVVGGPHDFLPPRSDRSDEFQKLWCIMWLGALNRPTPIFNNRNFVCLLDTLIIKVNKDHFRFMQIQATKLWIMCSCH